IERDTHLDEELRNNLIALAKEKKIPVESGLTLCADDFYEAAIVCVALLNRMKGDQVKIPHDQYVEFEERPFRLVTALIRKQLGIN
ncbi:hypothetical protein OSTOST_09081, partial [Ostertagia ostertagi]